MNGPRYLSPECWPICCWPRLVLRRPDSARQAVGQVCNCGKLRRSAVESVGVTFGIVGQRDASAARGDLFGTLGSSGGDRGLAALDGAAGLGDVRLYRVARHTPLADMPVVIEDPLAD